MIRSSTVRIRDPHKVYPEEAEEIRDRVAAAINSMGSHFFQITVLFSRECEAVYAERLWSNTKRIGNGVTYYANPKPRSYVPHPY